MDDCHDWCLLYEALMMPHFMKTGNQRWKHYRCYLYEIPTHHELQHMKYMIFTGSGRSVYELKIPWLPLVQDLVRKIMNQYSHLRMFAGCFGE